MDVGVPAESICFVSTYPPTVCGLASYTASLVDGLSRARRSRFGLGVVDVVDGHPEVAHPDVVCRLRRDDAASLERATRVLNSYGAVSIQHEFGIFGGRDGVEVLDLVEGVTVPVAVTFHTVLDDPSQHQRSIVDRLAERADRVLVMSDTGAERLTRRYDVDADVIEVIPHGADAMVAGPSLVRGGRPLVLTWGLIGPGKGLETAIEAFAEIADLDPSPRYLIAGATHPNVRLAAGESYRESLVSLVARLGLDRIVEFDDRYFDRATLARLVRSADLVVLPYESVEQVTSGVLVEAIAAAKPVVATRFPHAVELLSGGAGITVPHADPTALAGGLRAALTDRRMMSRMAKEAGRLADGWSWPTIGRRFGAIMSDIAGPGRPVAVGSGARVATG